MDTPPHLDFTDLFQRFWDDTDLTWSLCPAKIPDQHTTANPTLSQSGAASQSLSASTSSLPRTEISDGTPEPLKQSQTSSTLLTPSPSAFSQITGTDGTVEIGPYRCTTTIGLKTLLNLLYDYIQQTATTVDANLIYLTFNCSF